MKIVRYDGSAPISGLGAGGSFYVPNFVPDAKAIFEKLREEIKWRTVMARGHKMHRLKEAFVDFAADGTYPLYRYPFMFHEVVPFHPVVDRLRKLCQDIDQDHPINHAISTLYPNGTASISHHQDKQTDLAAGSMISDLSFGAPRTFVLTNGTVQQEIILQPGSLMVLDAETNDSWTHSVPEDRSVKEPRISIVFRSISTRYDPATDLITKADGQQEPLKEKKSRRQKKLGVGKAKIRKAPRQARSKAQ